MPIESYWFQNIEQMPNMISPPFFSFVKQCYPSHMKAYFEHDKIVHALKSLHDKYVNPQHSTLHDFWKSYVY